MSSDLNPKVEEGKVDEKNAAESNVPEAQAEAAVTDPTSSSVFKEESTKIKDTIDDLDWMEPPQPPRNLQTPYSTPKEADGANAAAITDERTVDNDTQMENAHHRAADKFDEARAYKDWAPKAFESTKTEGWNFDDLGSFEPPKPPGDTPRGYVSQPISAVKKPKPGPRDPPKSGIVIVWY
ncbi:hypothetical protein C8R43DRAFT_1133698 [Mycena crocata]|nr:hypothetical protein C8R43DRAFT_1133698 [Mycena crocata]